MVFFFKFALLLSRQIQNSRKETSLQGGKEEEEEEEQETATGTDRGDAPRGSVLTTATRFRGVHPRGPGNDRLATLILCFTVQQLINSTRQISPWCHTYMIIAAR